MIFNYGGVRQPYREVGSVLASRHCSKCWADRLRKRRWSWGWSSVVERFPKHVQGPGFDPKHQQREKTHFWPVVLEVIDRGHLTLLLWGLWSSTMVQACGNKMNCLPQPHTKRKELYYEFPRRLPTGLESFLLTPSLIDSTTSPEMPPWIPSP